MLLHLADLASLCTQRLKLHGDQKLQEKCEGMWHHLFLNLQFLISGCGKFLLSRKSRQNWSLNSVLAYINLRHCRS